MSAEPAALHPRSQTFGPHPVELERASNFNSKHWQRIAKAKAPRPARQGCQDLHAFSSMLFLRSSPWAALCSTGRCLPAGGALGSMLSAAFSLATSRDSSSRCSFSNSSWAMRSL